MENLNLFYLKCFLDAVQMGSISESARRNFVSQSAVSQAIKKLELSLNTILSTHQKQQFEPTEEGKIIASRAEEVFSAVRRLYDSLDQHKKVPQGPVPFVTTHSLGLSLLPDYLIDFRRSYPEVEVRFQFGGISQIKGWLKQGVFEFAIVLGDVHFEDYQSFLIYKGNFCVYKHPLEKKKMDELGVYVENQSGFLVPEFQDAYQKSYHKSMPVRQELNSWEFMAKSIEYQKGYALLPDFITKQKRYADFIPEPKPSLRYVIQAVFPKGRALSYSAMTFLQLLKEHLAR